jgi:hypothetical protein
LRGSSRRLSSTTSPTSCVRVPRHVAWLVVWLIVDYFASHRLVRHASGCLGTSRGSSRHSSSTTFPTLRAGCLGTSCGSLSTSSPTPRVRVPRHVARLVVDYFAYVVRPGASARHAARRRLLRLRCASGCLGTSRSSSLTTSPTPCVRVPRHVTRLVIDYSVHRDFVLRTHWLYFSHVVCCDYLSRGNTGSTSSTSRAAATSSSGRITSTIHLD